jgi:hypothetical protein
MTLSPEARVALLLVGVFVGGWAAWALVSWARYGRDAGTQSGSRAEQFVPDYEVVELFRRRVHAPAPLTLSVARSTSLTSSALIRGIFRARELMMRSHIDKPFPAGGVVDQMLTLGWSMLDSAPRREIVLGAVTQPWRGDVVFRALPPGEFIAFHEPGFVKIVVVIAADPVDDSTSVFRIETFVATTDTLARKRFRRYWSVFSPGILLIRQLALNAVKRDAEERYRQAQRGSPRSTGEHAPGTPRTNRRTRAPDTAPRA